MLFSLNENIAVNLDYIVSINLCEDDPCSFEVHMTTGKSIVVTYADEASAATYYDTLIATFNE